MSIVYYFLITPLYKLSNTFIFTILTSYLNEVDSVLFDTGAYRPVAKRRLSPSSFLLAVQGYSNSTRSWLSSMRVMSSDTAPILVLVLGVQHWYCYWREGFLKQSNKKVWKALQSREKIHFSQANLVRISYYSPKPIGVWTRKKFLLFYFCAFVSITDISMTDIVSVFFY